MKAKRYLLICCFFLFASGTTWAGDLVALERAIEKLYAPYRFSANEPLYLDELELIFNSKEKKEELRKQLYGFRAALDKKRASRCEKNLSDHYVRLALCLADLYNLEEGDQTKRLAKEAAEHAVRCDPSNAKARRLLQKLQ